MEITRTLNVVFRVDGEKGPVEVHAAPLSETAFRHHFMLVAKVYSALTQNNMVLAGPRVAALLMRQVAEESGKPEAAEAFFAELRRSAHVFVEQGGRWVPYPLQLALDPERGVLTATDQGEVESMLTFFTCFSAILPRRSQPGFAEGLTSASGGRTTSLNATEFAASLPTSTAVGSSGGRGE